MGAVLGDVVMRSSGDSVEFRGFVRIHLCVGTRVGSGVACVGALATGRGGDPSAPPHLTEVSDARAMLKGGPHYGQAGHRRQVFLLATRQDKTQYLRAQQTPPSWIPTRPKAN